MNESEARRRVREARVARLATVDETLQPHLVPVVFALEDDLLWIAIDQKPKTTTDLKRLRNIEAHPRVSVLVDEYVDDDWTQLWWVRVDGEARILADHDRQNAIRALQHKYEQHDEDPPRGPVIEIAIDIWRFWEAIQE